MSAKIVRYNLGAKSVVSVRNPRASITFTNASGTQIFIDSSSKDQWFTDSVAFTDSLNFDLSLALSDSFSFIDSIVDGSVKKVGTLVSISFLKRTSGVVRRITILSGSELPKIYPKSSSKRVRKKDSEKIEAPNWLQIIEMSSKNDVKK